ncbi:hypothetical protein [Streptomyces sp. NPDC101150]|uniref:hypothetical protein n=1 Tax=Streptomyces sp. NPDC101150 TaxID=3366114 RepID=UPI0037F4989C
MSTHADCAAGLVSGGGINQAFGTGAGVNGNHVNGTAPSSDGTSEYTGSTGVVGTDVTHWLGIGGSGGQVNASFFTTPYAVCLTSNLINHTQVVMNKANIPTTGATVGLVVATCPAGTRLLGGGARTTPGNTGTFKTIAGFPTFNNAAHDFGQKAAADGETNPDSWAAVGGIGGGRGENNMTYAYAICSGNDINLKRVATTVHFSEVDGPNTASTGQQVTAGCSREDGQLVSGGTISSALMRRDALWERPRMTTARSSSLGPSVHRTGISSRCGRRAARLSSSPGNQREVGLRPAEGGEMGRIPCARDGEQAEGRGGQQSDGT